MFALAQQDFPVKKPGRRLARIDKSREDLCPTQLGKNAGLDGSLKIEGKVITDFSYTLQRAGYLCGCRRTKEMLAPSPRIQGVNVIDDRLLRAHAVRAGFSTLGRKQLRPALFHQPAYGGVGKSVTDCGCCRQRVQNVSHGPEPDNQDFGHSRLSTSFFNKSFSRRSVVEWSFGSPTMATRPPQASTTSRSGTFSSV